MSSPTMYIEGIQPADDEWERMKNVWDTCTEAGVAIPDEVHDFFEGEDPNDMPGGRRLNLGRRDGAGRDEGNYKSSAFSSVDGEMKCAVLIDLDKLREDYPNLRQILITNHW